MLRFLTAGESHGQAEVAILEGVAAGLAISKEEIQEDLDKRRGGAGRGGRGIIEKDRVRILSGVRHGYTLGSPITLLIENSDFANWKETMDVEPQSEQSKKVTNPRPGHADNITHPGGMLASPLRKITNPRPGHADLAGLLKYGFDDIRNVIERASARETIMRVAVGAICRKLLLEIGIEIASHTVQIGQVKLDRIAIEFKQVQSVYDTDPTIRCIDKEVSKKMSDEIQKARLEKNTLGGIVETIAHNVPVGLGSFVHWDRKLDGRLAQALMSIHSVKAVEIGDGVTNAQLFGSQVHDEIFPAKQGDTLFGYKRLTNHAGGIEGGVSNGQDIVCRAFHKPISTLGNPLNTIDIKTGKKIKALVERSDICVVPRAGVISEAMITYELADTCMEKFGGDSIKEFKRNYKSYIT